MRNVYLFIINTSNYKTRLECTKTYLNLDCVTSRCVPFQCYDVYLFFVYLFTYLCIYLFIYCR
jgi:hypothetical protein